MCHWIWWTFFRQMLLICLTQHGSKMQFRELMNIVEGVTFVLNFTILAAALLEAWRWRFPP